QHTAQTSLLSKPWCSSYPSRFCQLDLLARFAKREFNTLESGFERVTRICNWIYEYVAYVPGLTNSSSSVFDTATQRAGMCRDFAPLGIAFCRSLGIPARFVSSYAYGLNPLDFHAHFEAFLGGHWILFNPNRLRHNRALSASDIDLMPRTPRSQLFSTLR
ncbi:MAG: transglutaminase family protein, partial [Chthoniobacterales bacterium]